MSSDFVGVRRKGRRHAVVVTVGLLAVLAGSALVLGFVEKVRDASDRTH